MYLSYDPKTTLNPYFGHENATIWPNIRDFIKDVKTYRLLNGRGVPLGHIGTGVAISARGPIWLSSANMT